MKITQTNGNKLNGIYGSRLRYYDSKNKLVGELIIPTKSAKYYIRQHPTGKYAKRAHELFLKAINQEDL